MKKRKYLLFILFALICIANACEDILQPEDSNVKDINDVRSVVTYAEGVLLTAYENIPHTVHNNFTLAYASDDAVNNVPSSNIKNIVSGGWTSSSNPFGVWTTAYKGIYYINTFLEQMQSIDWYWKNKETSDLFREKLNGEAYALRAWYYFHLLQAHAGMGKNGKMLGVPIVDKVLKTANPSDYQLPRSSFDDLVQFIINDCDSAIAILPDRWINTGNAADDIAIGAKNTNRINGLVARLIKAKTLLYAASPAYSDGTYTYQMAAQAAAKLMDANNGLADVASGTVEFYNNTRVVNNGNKDPEVLWYSSRQNSSNNWERSNYPPSLYGGGLTNPSQELVNAFPMKDGTPTPLSKINSADPYSDRDPRLEKFILFNGAQFKRGNKTITISTTEGSQDGVGSTDEKATKTGYYLKKFMAVGDVNLDPKVNSGGLHYYTYARYTDALLIFAEAANEAVGPDGNIGGYTARDVINAIRQRAGITSTDYVDGLDQSRMTELIRNERRIEMCFEKQRFWDLRRWKLTETMKQPVHGVQIFAGIYSYIQVEDRNYADYQIYGPIPYGETLKYNLIQNEGWK